MNKPLYSIGQKVEFEFGDVEDNIVKGEITGIIQTVGEITRYNAKPTEKTHGHYINIPEDDIFSGSAGNTKNTKYPETKRYKVGDIVKVKNGNIKTGKIVACISNPDGYDIDLGLGPDNPYFIYSQNVLGLVSETDNSEIKSLRKIIEQNNKDISSLENKCSTLEKDIERLEKRFVRLDNAADEAIENAIEAGIQYEKLYDEHQKLKKELEEYKGIEKDGWQKL